MVEQSSSNGSALRLQPKILMSWFREAILGTDMMQKKCLHKKVSTRSTDLIYVFGHVLISHT